MIHIILTLDYETFGNGAGDIRQTIITPTERILEICDRRGVRTTIMFEAAEYWAFQKYDKQLREVCGYSPSDEIAKQVVNAAERGHDVQLHIHPWWIGATFEGQGWQLCAEQLRITDLPSGMGSEDDASSVIGVLSRGKRTLEAMIRPVSSQYACLVYRAAMFYGQPSKDLIIGMRKVGLVADSSVIGGLYETDPVPTDYRQATSAAGYWWTSAEDISQSGAVGDNIIEFPVYSRLMPYLWNLKWTKLYVTLKRGRMEAENPYGHGMMDARRSIESPWRALRRLGTVQPFKYDFCKLGAKDMIAWLLRLLRRTSGEGDLGSPVVMLGHSKDFWNDRNLEGFLKFVTTECEGRVCFSTLGDFTRRILEKNAPS